MEFLKIWLLCIVAAVIYGILHDQATARVCVEYFSVAHPMSDAGSGFCWLGRLDWARSPY